MGLPGTTRPGGDELAQLLAGGGSAPGIVGTRIGSALRSRLLLLSTNLLVLTLAEQGRHLLGLKQAG